MNEHVFFNKYFEDYFFYGLENRETLIESMIYFSYKEYFERHSLEDLHLNSIEQEKEEINNIATDLYTQYYRFIVLNDEPDKFVFKVDRNKMKDIIEKVANEFWEKVDYIDTKSGRFIPRYPGDRFKESPIYKFEDRTESITKKTIGKNEETVYYNAPVQIGNWTRQLVDILFCLDEIEKKDKIKYLEKWFQVKLARATNRNDPKEIENIKLLINIFEEKKKKLERANEKEDFSK